MDFDLVFFTVFLMNIPFGSMSTDFSYEVRLLSYETAKMSKTVGPDLYCPLSKKCFPQLISKIFLHIVTFTKSKDGVSAPNRSEMGPNMG